MTNSYITKIQNINLLEGIFAGEIFFENGLNIISGENGTGKTKLLQHIKSGQKEFSGDATDKIVIFNPKRNAEKQNLDHFADKLRKQGISSLTISKTLKAQNINDGSFLPYPAFGELFITRYDEIMRKEGNIGYADAIKRTADDFNSILKKVFSGYEIIAEWKDEKPDIKFKKNENLPFPSEGLSCGESEVFSLMFNIYANKDYYDIYLIDEPEIHLNWSLEEGLFNFMDWFCKTYGKQIITATHSRIIFQDQFLQKIQFLNWDNSKIVIQRDINKELKEKIAGDAIKIVSALDLHSQNFFVEDGAHVKVIEEIAKVLDKDVGTTKLGNCSNVKSFCRVAEKEKMANACFIVDGDNQGIDAELQSSTMFVHLKKYCIQNYLLNTEILSQIAVPVITEEDVEEKIKQCLKDLNKDSKLLVFQKLAEVSDIPYEVLDTFDASKIINSLAQKLGLNDFSNLTEQFINKAQETGKLNEIFGEITVKIK